MAILPSHSPHCFGIFMRSMIQADHPPLSEMLNSSSIAEVFEEDKIVFGIADEEVFTPVITSWAMVSQNAGNFCRAKAKIPTAMRTYNLVRLKLPQSGYAAGREIRSMSFTEISQLLATNWLLCACVAVNPAMATSAQAQGVCAIVGNRPDRSEPRENKRRPKVLKLMTISRKVFKAALAALRKIA